MGKRDDLHSRLDRAYDLIENHKPEPGEEKSPGKDAAMRESLEHLNHVLDAFSPAIRHLFHRELQATGDPDEHRWATNDAPFAPAEKINSYREAIARLLVTLPALLPNGAAKALAGSLLSANQGDLAYMFEPSAVDKKGKGKRPGLASSFTRQMGLHVYYRAGLMGETITAARAHYADLTGLENVGSVDRWDGNSRKDDSYGSALAAARALGEARRTGSPEDRTILKTWEPRSDAVFAKAYKDLIPNRRSRRR